ncbi:MAG TPA: tyrosine-type recombinase/integrase [Micromonosporaceae bacterium]
MGHIVKTTAGTYRANWRDAAGRQKAKTFKTRKEAAAFLAETETAVVRGTYVDPHAGRTRFGEYAMRWLEARNSQINTSARDQSIIRIHVMPQWGSVPLGKVDHLAVQRWVTELGKRLSPATVAKCYQLTSAVFKAAVRDRLIGVNPCEGVKLPSIRQKDTDDQVVTPDVVTGRILPAVPARYRALVALAAGTGLRWGECVGLRWDAFDWDGWDIPCMAHAEPFCADCRDEYAVAVRVVRVAVEVAGNVTMRPFPKSRSGRRTVPVPPFAADLLKAHQAAFPAGPANEVFTNQASGPLRRTLFRARVWRPALVRAGLLGQVDELGPDKWRATWPDAGGVERCAEFAAERDAVKHVAKHAAGGLRFHDLRHSYATWLVSSGVPVNEVARVMGHSRSSTTLNRYTHTLRQSRDDRVRRAFADDSLTPPPPEDQE